MKALRGWMWMVGLLLVMVGLNGGVRAASVSFAWTANTEPELAGYKLYYGPNPGTYTNHVVLGLVTTYRMSNLVNGATYYFALAAFDTNDMESGLTPELQFPNPPALAAIQNQTTPEDTSVTVNLLVSDVDTPVGNLTLSATSTNLTLVPVANISFSGTSSNRSMLITPAANQSGTTRITVTVSDGTLTASRNFILTVNGTQDAPTISSIADVTTDEDVQTGAISFTVNDLETPAANLTVTATTGNASLIPTNRITLGGTGNSRTVTLRPTTNQNGTASITLTVSDGTSSASTTFGLTVRPVNDSPTITAINDVSVAEDTTSSPIAFTIHDIDTPIASLQVTAGSSNPSIIPAQNITLSGGTGTNRTVSVRSATNAVGSSVITVTVSDGQGSASETFTVNVTNANDAPTISSIADVTTDEDVPTATISFTVNDLDTPAASLTVQATTSNASLIPTNRITLAGTGNSRTVTLRPTTNQTGTASITLTVSDGALSSSTAFNCTVSAVNDPPTITAINDVGVVEDTTSNPIAFTINDIDTAVASLQVTAGSSNPSIIPAENITLSGGTGTNRTVSVRPATNAVGSSVITITVSDGQGSASETFTVNVTNGNDAPTISSIADVTTDEDVQTSSIAFTVDDLDTPVGNLTVRATTSNASLIPTNRITLGGTGNSRTVTLRPTTNQSGSASITLTVSDGTLNSSTTFGLTVRAVNDSPTIVPINDVSVAEDTTSSAIPFIINDIDTPIASLQVSASSSNPGIIPGQNVVLNGGAGTNRTVSVLPATNAVGNSVITITVSDGQGTASETFTVTVTNVNDAPEVSQPTDIVVDTFDPVPISFTVSDVETPASSLGILLGSTNHGVLPPANIVLSGTGTNRTLTLTPIAFGVTRIGIHVNDGVATNRVFFSLTVNGTEAAPTISGVTDAITDEDVFTSAIAFTVNDVDTPATNLTVRATSSNPSLIPTNRITLGGTGNARTMTLRPLTNQNGSASITLTVSDGALSSSTNFSFTVRPVNDLPTITAINDVTVAEDTTSGTISFTINDVETATPSLQVTANSSNPAIIPEQNVVLNGGTGTNRTVSTRPATNAVGNSMITINVSDGQASASETFTVNVTAVNDAPYVSQPADLTVNKFDPIPPVSFTVWDVETAASSLSITVTSTNTALLPTATNMVVSGTGTNRALNLVPVGIGTTRIGIHVSDAGQVTNRVFFQFTVTGTNNAPVLTVPGALTGRADDPIALQGISVEDPDVRTNNMNFTMSAPNGTVTIATSVANGVRPGQVSGNNSGAVTIVAPLTALNATFAASNGVTYTSRSDFQGTETVVLSVSDNGFSGLGGVKTDTESIAIEISGSNGSGIEIWRTANFSATDLQDPAKEATVWGDLADPDNDGRENLMEYALGSNPWGSEPQDSIFVSQLVSISGSQYQTLTFNARTSDATLQYVPEVSADNSTWTASAVLAGSTVISPDFARVTYRDPVPITSEGARFIRLRVVRNSP